MKFLKKEVFAKVRIDFKDLETELKIRSYSQNTIDTYIYHNQQFIDYMNASKTGSEYQKSLMSKGDERTPQDATRDDLRAFLAFLLSDKSQTPASANLALSSLKFFYLNVLKKDIFTGVTRPKSEKKIPVVLTKEEIKAMLESCKKKKQKLLIEFLYSTGLRVSEAVNVRQKDLNLQEKVVFVKYGKGKKERFVKLSSKFITHFKSYLKNKKDGSEYVFSFKGKPISARQAQRIVKNAANRAGITKKVFCHALRSTYATHLLNKGYDIRIIQELLGHEDLSTTQKYTKVSREKIMEVRSPLDDM